MTGHRLLWIVAAAIGGTIALALLLTGGSSNSARGISIISSTPEPITRAELMHRYAQIAPLDRTATPSGMDELADTACQALDAGITTDQVIGAGNSIYGANATEVSRLLVSYRCPNYLGDFK